MGKVLTLGFAKMGFVIFIEVTSDLGEFYHVSHVEFYVLFLFDVFREEGVFLKILVELGSFLRDDHSPVDASVLLPIIFMNSLPLLYEQLIFQLRRIDFDILRE